MRGISRFLFRCVHGDELCAIEIQVWVPLVRERVETGNVPTPAQLPTEIFGKVACPTDMHCVLLDRNELKKSSHGAALASNSAETSPSLIVATRMARYNKERRTNPL